MRPWIRNLLTAGKVGGAALALATFVFAVYQFYDSNIEKRKERAAAEVQRFQTYAASPAARLIRAQSEAGEGKQYKLTKFTGGSDQFLALLNFFNLAESIAYLYNEGVIDPVFIDANLLCTVEKQYRTFILADGSGGTEVIEKINNRGVFPIGLFENLDKLHRSWISRTFNGLSVETRCGAQWGRSGA